MSNATDSGAIAYYGIRQCRDHWHVTAAGEDAITTPADLTREQALTIADRLNAARTAAIEPTQDMFVATPTPPTAPPREGESEPLGVRIANNIHADMPLLKASRETGNVDHWMRGVEIMLSGIAATIGLHSTKLDSPAASLPPSAGSDRMENKIIPVPTRYRLYTTKLGRSVNVEIRSGPEEPEKWAVTWDDEVLRKDGLWEWEPQPSSRTDEFKKDTRYDTVGEAVAQFERWLERTGGL